MAELRYVDRAAYSPTQCALCTTHEGPFIDTGVEFVGYGHVYICASHSGRSGCVRQMGHRDGMITIERAAEGMDEIDVLRRRVAELEADLEESRVVPMNEVLAHLAKTSVVVRPEPAPVGKE